jgi:hypothetical protein
MELDISIKEKKDIKINSEKNNIISNLDIKNRQKLVNSTQENKQQNTIQNNSLSVQTKPIDVCIADLKALGLDDKEIEKLDSVIDSIIDNRLDFIFNKLYN